MLFSGSIGGGINGILNSMTELLAGAQQSLEQNLTTMNTKNGGQLDPAQMAQLQICTQNYLAFIQSITSLIKQFGDLDKTVATNMGQ